MTFDNVAPEKYEKWYEEKNGKLFDKLEKELILKMINPKSGESLLEIGCGTGHFLKWLKTFGLKLTGVDLSRIMISYASKNLSQDIKFKVADADNLPFKDNSFDIAMFIATLEFLNESKKALEEAIRVSKDKIFIGFLNKLSFLTLGRRIKGFFKDSVYNKATFYTVFEIKKMLKEINPEVKISKIEGIKTKLGPLNLISPFVGVLVEKS